MTSLVTFKEKSGRLDAVAPQELKYLREPIQTLADG
jgi:hypothetical protein